MDSSAKKNTFKAISVVSRKINLANLTYIKLWSFLANNVNIIKCSLFNTDQYVLIKDLLSNLIASSNSKLFISYVSNPPSKLSPIVSLIILVFVEDFVLIIKIESLFEKFLFGGMFLNLLETLVEDFFEIRFLLLWIGLNFFFSVSKVSGKKGYPSLIS